MNVKMQPTATEKSNMLDQDFKYLDSPASLILKSKSTKMIILTMSSVKMKTMFVCATEESKKVQTTKIVQITAKAK